MLTSKNIKIATSLTLVLFVFSACGGNGSDEKSTTAPADNNLSILSENNNTTINNSENNTSQPQPIVVGYTAGENTLIETKSDGTKLAWVNSTGTACLVYHLGDTSKSIYDRGVEYCSSLVYSGLDTWRLPTVDESIYFMSHVPVDKSKQSGERNTNTDVNYIIYPSNGLSCQYMATATEDTYAFTTNNIARLPEGSWVKTDQGASGIRCVANQ